MINTVLFDLGNVVLPFDVTRLANRLTSHSPFSPSQIIEKLWNDHIANHFETGRMSPEQYFSHVSEICQFTGLTFEAFVPLFNEIFEEDAEIITLILQLKNRYKLGLISNTNSIHVSYILKKFPNLFLFDRHWFSNEAGIRKPNPAIFTMALDYFSITPSESVFIDDMPINVDSAKTLGMNAIVYIGIESLKENLNTLGVTY